jgi:hypothetical protein
MLTVMTRTTSATALLRLHRVDRREPVSQPRPPGHCDHAADSPGDELGDLTAARVRRRAIAPQDQAMYTCRCGYVFAAEVSTSVGCPYCGVAQAW